MAQFIPVKFPNVPGGPAFGVVDEVCDGVDNATVGDEVFGFAVIRLAPPNTRRYTGKSAGPSWAEAAALPAAAETAMRALDLLGVVASPSAGPLAPWGARPCSSPRARRARVIGTCQRGQS